MTGQLLTEIILAITQAFTEFLPISSSGHLALLSNLIGNPNLSFIIFLHLASLLAVVFYTRKEIWRLLHFKKEDKKYLLYLLIGILPTGLAGLFLKSFVENQLNSFLFIGVSFLFTGMILLTTKNSSQKNKIGLSSSISIGLTQILAIFPGVSRSGMTISTAKIMNVKNQDAFKFSFLLFIPLSLGAFILDINQIVGFSWIVLIPFFICMILSFFCLKILEKVLIANKFWMFSIYCFIIGVLTLLIWIWR